MMKGMMKEAGDLAKGLDLSAGVAFAPGTPDATWSIYVHDGKVYIPAKVRTRDGATFTTGPIAIVDASDETAVAVAIMAEAARNMPVVPKPNLSSPEHLNRPSVKKAAGVKNYRGFSGWGLVKQGGKFYAVQLRVEADGANVPAITKEAPHADAASAANQIAARIVQSQPSAQTTCVPAKAKGKPKPAKAATTARNEKPDVEPKPKRGELTIEQLAATATKAKRPTEAQIAAFEATLPAPLPPDYRRFLLLCNGEVDFDRVRENADTVVSSFHTITRVKHLQTLESVRETMQDPDAPRISEEVLPIGNGVVGDSICIGLAGRHRGKIFLWDHENEPDPDEWDGTVKGSKNTEVIAASFTELVGKMTLTRG